MQCFASSLTHPVPSQKGTWVKDPEYPFRDSENKPIKQSKVKPEVVQAAAERADRVRRCGRVDHNDQVTTSDEHLFYDTKPTKGEHQVAKVKT